MITDIIKSVFLLLAGITVIQGSGHIREAINAGRFYPASEQALQQEINLLLDNANPPGVNGQIYGLIAPHAGYAYSGHVAACAYKTLQKAQFRRVIVLSPSHIDAFKGVSVYNGKAYATPLGQIPIDQGFSRKLSASHRLFKYSERGHTNTYRGRGEHALEVQLPFLQQTLSDFQLVAVIMGDRGYVTCRALACALDSLVCDKHTLIVASSDLSHFHTYEGAQKLDQKVINAIKEWDFLNLHRNLQNKTWEACGGGPVVAMMMALQRMGIKGVRLLKYANSGDVTANRSRVVGYSAMAFYDEGKRRAGNKKDFFLSEAAQIHLMQIVRSAVEAAVCKGYTKDVNAGGFEELRLDRAAFVTIKKDGRLRGCIGYTSPIMPLFKTVCEAAIAAAVRDPRFAPIKPEELPDLQYQISVLSPFNLVRDITMIHPGRHGLFIKCGARSGLLLPQVAERHGWDRATFLEHTCTKAGLPEWAWKQKQTDIFRFTAEVFGDY